MGGRGGVKSPGWEVTEPSVREQDLTPCLMLPVQAGVGKVDDWLSDLRGSGMLARVRRDPRGDDEGVYGRH